MPNPQKNKGNKNERETAEVLTEWWGSAFKRIPNSGALRWNGASFVYGDLLPPENFPGIIECKHYKSIDLDEILRCKESDHNIIGWWRQVVDDVVRCRKDTSKVVEPILVYKADYRTRRIVVRRVVWEYFLDDIYKAVKGTLVPSYLSFTTVADLPDFCILKLDDFLEFVRPEEFRHIHETELTTWAPIHD